MGKLEMVDTYGVPEFFYTHMGDIEDAGSGMIRIVRCVERHGVLVPVFSTVAPATKVITFQKIASDFARKVLLEYGCASH